MKKFDTVIFDMDGTLLNTLDDLWAAVNYALREAGMKERTLDEVRAFVGNGVEKLMRRSVSADCDEETFERTFKSFKAYYAKHSHDRTGAYAGVVELLRELKEDGYALAIVSNKLDSAVKELSRVYFDGIVKVAIGDQPGLAKKPAPDMVEAALKELGKTKEHAVYVGDSDVDFLTAKNSGLPCISVLWGFRDKDFLVACGADRFAETPEDVQKIVKNM
jgi:phosphoglycolate phosphatase